MDRFFVRYRYLLLFLLGSIFFILWLNFRRDSIIFHMEIYDFHDVVLISGYYIGAITLCYLPFLGLAITEFGMFLHFIISEERKHVKLLENNITKDEYKQKYDILISLLAQNATELNNYYRQFYLDIRPQDKYYNHNDFNKELSEEDQSHRRNFDKLRLSIEQAKLERKKYKEKIQDLREEMLQKINKSERIDFKNHKEENLKKAFELGIITKEELDIKLKDISEKDF